MKGLLIFVVCSFLGLSEQGPILTWREQMQLNEECNAETSRPKSYLKDFVREVKIPLDDQKYAEYLTCYYQKQGFQTEEGVIHYDNISEFVKIFFNEDEAKTAVDSCRNLKGSTNGEKAVFFSNCVVEKHKEIKAANERFILRHRERKRMRDECIAKTRISKSYLEEIVKVPLNNQKFAEYLTCYYKKQGFQTEEGVIHYDNMKEFLGNLYNEDKAKNAVDSCRNLNGSTDGEKAVLFANCIMEKLIESEEERSEESEEGRSVDCYNDVNNENTGNSDIFVKKITDSDNTVNTNKISVVNTGDNNETTANNNDGIADIA